MSEPNNAPLNGSVPLGYSGEMATVGSPRFYLAELGNGQAEPPHSQRGFSLAFVWYAVTQWWKLALPIALLLSAAASGGAYLTFRPVYQAEAYLQIEDARPYIAFQSNEDSRRFVATQIALIRSPLVLGPVVSQPEISALAAAEEQEEPIRWLSTGIKVASVDQSQLHSISFSCHDASGSAKVVNAVVKAYFDLQRSTEAAETQRVIELLEEESHGRQAEVTRLRDNIRSLAEQAAIKDPLAPKSDAKVLVTNPLGDLQAKLANAEFARELLQAQITAMKESLFGLGLQATTGSDGSATVKLHGRGNDFTIAPTTPTTSLEGVRVVLDSRIAPKGQSVVVFDPKNKTLLIDVDPLTTTAETIIKRISSEGTFQAALAPESGADNDGTGLLCQVKVEISDADVERAVGQHPDVQAARTALASKHAKRQDMKAKLARGESDPVYQQLDMKVRQDEQTLEEFQNKLREQAKAEMLPALVRERTQELAELQAKLDSARLMADLLKKRCDSELKNVSQSSSDTVDMEFSRTELARAEQVFDLIESRIVKLRTEQRAPARVSLLQEAEPPKKPVEMVPYRHIWLASLAGLCVPFVLAVGWERIVRRVSDPNQLEREALLPIVGEIAHMPAGGRGGANSTSQRRRDQYGMFEESVDALRTGLVLAEPLQQMKVLSVTSAVNNEGKTSIAVQLAVSIARASGETVLLIDGDMRSPDIHALLGVNLEPGLADVLNHRTSPSDAIITSWSQRVHLLPAGKLLGNPHRLLGNGALKALMDDVVPRYRYVIIDTPPILAASEALVLAKAADANIICTMRDASRLDQVKRTRDRLQATGARTVGIVLNGVPYAQYAYRYGHTYAYKRRSDSE